MNVCVNSCVFPSHTQDIDRIRSLTHGVLEHTLPAHPHNTTKELGPLLTPGKWMAMRQFVQYVDTKFIFYHVVRSGPYCARDAGVMLAHWAHIEVHARGRAGHDQERLVRDRPPRRGTTMVNSPVPYIPETPTSRNLHAAI